MNRTTQIERIIEKKGFGFDTEIADSFRRGAQWADTHPLYEDSIPLRADKTPGECLLLVKKLAYCKGASDTFKGLYSLVKANIDLGRSPFNGIGYFTMTNE